MSFVVHREDRRGHEIVFRRGPRCFVFFGTVLVCIVRLQGFPDGPVDHLLPSCNELIPDLGVQAPTVLVCPEVQCPICQGEDTLSVPFGQSKKCAVVHFLLLRDPGLQPLRFTTHFWDK